MEQPAPLARRARALIDASPDGVEASLVGVLLGVSWPTAASVLARMFWRGEVDRYKPTGARAYLYVPRVKR